ncbi:hypothetical protein B484DRAFT_467176, partial [Ochromonadaceae sp. CCMP2298]
MRSIAASFLLAVVALWSLLCVHGAEGLTNSMPAQAKSISFSALMQTQKIQHKLEKEDEGVSALSSKEEQAHEMLGRGVDGHLRGEERQVQRQGSGANGKETGEMTDDLGQTGLSSDNAQNEHATLTRMTH